MNIRIFPIIIFLGFALTIHAGDTNFVAVFSTEWQSQNASNILTFSESQISTNRNVETLFARGVVAAYLQKWGRGATNYFALAILNAQSNSMYSPVGRSNVVQIITEIKNNFDALTEDSGEPTNSLPTWDTNIHSVVFGELGGKAPLLSTLEAISKTQ